MAPEQMSGDPVDARTDVWALGVLLFELLTGRKPFQGGAWPAVCARVLSDAAPPLESLGDRVPAEVQSAVRRCLQRMPEDRFSNVAELAVALSPFGTRIARVSLEHIVRLATSTGSLAAESSSPLPRLPGNTPPGGFERERSVLSSSDASLLRDLALSERRDLALSERGDAARDFERRDFERRDLDRDDFDPREPQLHGEPSGEALRLERRRSSKLHLASVAAVRQRRVQWFVVAAAALVVVGVPWLVTRLLRPAAVELQAIQASLTEAPRRGPHTPPAIVEATPASVPGSAPPPVLGSGGPLSGAPAASGVAAPSGPILRPAGELLAASPPSTTLPSKSLPAAPFPAPSLPAAALPAPLPAEPQVRVLTLAEELAARPAALTERAPGEVGTAPAAALVVAAGPSAAAVPGASAATGQAPAEPTPVEPTPPQPAPPEPAPPEPNPPVQGSTPSAPRGANPWDFRDLEFE
jgi:serine/threonine-protein kinase